MMLALASVSQARWKQFYLPLLSSQKLGGGKVSEEGRFITWEGGREGERFSVQKHFCNGKSVQRGSDSAEHPHDWHLAASDSSQLSFWEQSCQKS